MKVLSVRAGHIGSTAMSEGVSAYLKAALDSVVMADASGCVVEWNPAAERTFGYTREEALGRTLADLIVPPSLRERHTVAFARFIETGEERLFGRRLELTGMRADGSEFPVELALSRVKSEPLLICGALRDLSEAKRAENDLRKLADEHAALRRVATLVAQQASPTGVFAAVAEEVQRILDVPLIEMSRYESDGTITVIGAAGAHPFQVGTHWPLDGPTVSMLIRETGLPAKVEYAHIPGKIAEAARQGGLRAGFGVPIIVDGAIWGVMATASTAQQPLPDDIEARLADFTELVATAISNTEARDALRKSEELYRRAISQAGAVPYVLDYASGAYTFIGEGIEELTGYTPVELTHELFGSLVLETHLHGDQAALDNYEAAHRTRAGEFERWRSDLRIRRRDGEIRWLSDASVEILNEHGRSLGSIGMLQDITERMKTDEERSRLAAILEATTDFVGLSDPQGRALYLNRAGRRMVGLGEQEDISNLSIADFHPASAASLVLQEGIPAASRGGVWTGENALLHRDGREIPVSQVLLAHRDPAGTVTFFSTIARDITERRTLETGLRQAQEEQGALRRVATLVAQEATPAEVFAAVAEEVAHTLDVPLTAIVRYEADETAIQVGAWGRENPFPVGTSWTLDAHSVSGLVWRTGRPARVVDYADVPGKIAATLAREAGVRTAVGVPIVVNGRLWGVMMALSTEQTPLPAATEAPLASFTELVATAIANTQAREELRRLAEEQAALRRVATLVARGTDSHAVFEAVCAETGPLIGATSVNLAHFTPDGVNVTMAGWSLRDTHVPTGTRLPFATDTINGLIQRTVAPARFDSYETSTSELATLIRQRGIRSEVGAPVIVEGQPWGALIAGTDNDELLPAGSEKRVASFAELIATAVSNATTRSELIASRARIVAAGDDARRRIERNLHDGTQQRLIALGLDLQAVQGKIPGEQQEAHRGVERIGRGLEAVLEDVRELSRGLHPALLSQGGLGTSLRALTRESPIRVNLDIEVDQRPPESIEIAVYYVVSEALTNAAKHSQASEISVTVGTAGTMLRATIEDDGVGGAEASAGSGLVGLIDRVEALGGRFALDSPPNAGTRISMELPLAGQPGGGPEPGRGTADQRFLLQTQLSEIAEARTLLAAVAAVADALYIVDAQGRIRFLNPTALEILGYEDERQLLGRPSHDTIHYMHRDGTPFPAAECPLLRPRVTGETIRVEEDWFVRQDESLVPVAYSSAPVSLPDGRGAVVTFRDLSERRRLE
jgi:PAS domain S-box-containing protein